MERAEGKKAQEETSFTRNRPRGRVKLEASFSKMNGTTSSSLTDDKAGIHCTRLQLPALLYMSCVKAELHASFILCRYTINTHIVIKAIQHMLTYYMETFTNIISKFFLMVRTGFCGDE